MMTNSSPTPHVAVDIALPIIALALFSAPSMSPVAASYTAMHVFLIKLTPGTKSVAKSTTFNLDLELPIACYIEMFDKRIPSFSFMCSV